MQNPHSNKGSTVRTQQIPEGGITDRQETLLVVVMLVFFIGFAISRLIDGLAIGSVLSNVFMVGVALLVPLVVWMVYRLFFCNRKP